MTVQSTNEGLAVQLACQGLVYRYLALIDSGRAADSAALFTDDGTWILDGFELAGVDRIRRAFEKRQLLTGRTTRHVCTNLVVDLVAPDAASAAGYLVLHKHEADTDVSGFNTASMVGDVRFELVEHAADGWRIKRMEVATPLGVGK